MIILSFLVLSPEEINMKELWHGAAITNSRCNSARKLHQVLYKRLVLPHVRDCHHHLQFVVFWGIERAHFLFIQYTTWLTWWYQSNSLSEFIIQLHCLSPWLKVQSICKLFKSSWGTIPSIVLANPPRWTSLPYWISSSSRQHYSNGISHYIL